MTTEEYDPSAAPLRVKLRSFTIAEAVTLHDANELDGRDAWFLPLENPPPVGSLLELSRDSAGAEPAWAFEVRRNALLGDSPRGCVGITVDPARLMEAAQEIGSEHLEPEPAPAPTAPRSSSSGSDSDVDARPDGEDAPPALAEVHDDEPEVLVLAEVHDDDAPLATGGGKLRKGRSRAE